MKTYFFSGGHAGSTAHALLSYISTQGIDCKIFFYGMDSTFADKKVESLQSKYFRNLKINFIPLKIQRINFKNISVFFRLISTAIQIILSTIKVIKDIKKNKPSLILSFGAFVGFPVVLAGRISNIPTLIHEQTTMAGRSNILSSFFADHVLISRESSRKFFNNKKIILTGNPIEQNILHIEEKHKPSSLKTVFITGGQSGAKRINDVIEQVIPNLTLNYNVIHQTGILEEKKFLEIRERMPNKSRYQVHGLIDPSKWYEYLQKADVVVSRSGANIVSQLIASKRPSILIPLPNSNYDEQFHNAMYASEYGIAKVIHQSQLTEKVLIKEIKFMFDNYSNIIENVRGKESEDENASKKIVEVIQKYQD